MKQKTVVFMCMVLMLIIGFIPVSYFLLTNNYEKDDSINNYAISSIYRSLTYSDEDRFEMIKPVINDLAINKYGLNKTLIDEATLTYNYKNIGDYYFVVYTSKNDNVISIALTKDDLTKSKYYTYDIHNILYLESYFVLLYVSIAVNIFYIMITSLLKITIKRY